MYIPIREKVGTCGICESDSVQVSLHYGNLWFCASCWSHEETATQVQQVPRVAFPITPSVQSIQPIIELVNQTSRINESIESKPELFNANTVAILERKQIIDSDSSIENKPYALGESLMNWFNQTQSELFDLNKQIVEKTNLQKAIHVYLNNMANQLRVDERAKLKIADINYNPKPVKTVKVREIKTRQTNAKTKYTKVELREAARLLGVSEFILATICAKGLSLPQAVEYMKKKISDRPTSSDSVESVQSAPALQSNSSNPVSITPSVIPSDSVDSDDEIEFDSSDMEEKE